MTRADPAVLMVTLGCPKNRVDSELLLGRFHAQGARFTDDAEEADILLVNTCGFIDAAKEESVHAIMDLARLKQESPEKKLVVTGCLAERYPEALRTEIPEIDVLTGNGAFETLDLTLEAQRSERSELSFLHDALAPRVNTFLPHSAYLKVAEGCDQRCSFCIIPSLRGLQRSRPVDDIVKEARQLVDRGIVELNLVAQDLTGYGSDLSPKVHITQVLEQLVELDGLRWVRIHYLFPRKLPDAFYDVFAHPKVAPYVDLPLQHVSAPILKAMRRPSSEKLVDRILERLRKARPDARLRTSFIVGFPGETEADHRAIAPFVERHDFDHVGVFRFSVEEGTPSADMPNQVPEDEAERRRDALMDWLRDRSRRRLSRWLGHRLEVLVDGPSAETELLLSARHGGQAPEVDGQVYINDGEARAGDFVEVEITDTFDYDMVGHMTRSIERAPARPVGFRMDGDERPGRLPIIS